MFGCHQLGGAIVRPFGRFERKLVLIPKIWAEMFEMSFFFYYTLFLDFTIKSRLQNFTSPDLYFMFMFWLLQLLIIEDVDSLGLDYLTLFDLLIRLISFDIEGYDHKLLLSLFLLLILLGFSSEHVGILQFLCLFFFYLETEILKCSFSSSRYLLRTKSLPSSIGVLLFFNRFLREDTLSGIWFYFSDITLVKYRIINNGKISVAY